MYILYTHCTQAAQHQKGTINQSNYLVNTVAAKKPDILSQTETQIIVNIDPWIYSENTWTMSTLQGHNVSNVSDFQYFLCFLNAL